MIFNVPTNLPPELIDHPTNLTKGTTTNDPTKSTGRSSYISWITSSNWLSSLVETYMRNLNTYYFQYDLTNLSEGMCQYTVYNEGDYYDWHVDEEPEVCHLMRKLSATIWLNDPDEYEGGEFDIEVRGPHDHSRYDSFKLPKGSIVVFPSNKWHRVRPVTSGVRKSLVTWFRGSPFK